MGIFHVIVMKILELYLILHLINSNKRFLFSVYLQYLKFFIFCVDKVKNSLYNLPQVKNIKGVEWVK